MAGPTVRLNNINIRMMICFDGRWENYSCINLSKKTCVDDSFSRRRNRGSQRDRRFFFIPLARLFSIVATIWFVEMSAAGTLCESPGCKLEARLQCPTCIKLEIKGSFFCSQECFKNNWTVHKSVHKKPNTVETAVYNPWPNYFFTGT